MDKWKTGVFANIKRKIEAMAPVKPGANGNGDDGSNEGMDENDGGEEGGDDFDPF